MSGLESMCATLIEAHEVLGILTGFDRIVIPIESM